MLVLVCTQTRVAQLEGIVVDDQVLVLSNVPLDDELTLAAYGVGEHDTFQVTARLLGGMNAYHCMHHSLL